MPAVSALLALVGVVAVAFALLNQQGDPPGVQSQSASVVDAASPTSEGDVSSAESTTSPTRMEPDASETTSGADSSAVAEPTPEPEPEPLSLESSKPLAVRIDSIDVSSDLHALGLTDDGALDVPSGNLYNQAAWYDGSPTPGEIGPAVIEGHVTSQGSVPSVFFDLGAVSRGDQIEVDRADGSTAVFEVYDTGSFPKDDFPSLAVYGRTNAAELRVITCGGDYSAEQRRHVDNVVVFARLVDAA